MACVYRVLNGMKILTAKEQVRQVKLWWGLFHSTECPGYLFFSDLVEYRAREEQVGWLESLYALDDPRGASTAQGSASQLKLIPHGKPSVAATGAGAKKKCRS
jgi:hypothetical protein